MAFANESYRSTKGYSSDEDSDAVISDEDSEANFQIRSRAKKYAIFESDEEIQEENPVDARASKTVICESSDEVDSEDDKSSLPFHSTAMFGHEKLSALVSDEELEEIHSHVEGERKISSVFSEKLRISAISSTNFDDDNIDDAIVISDEELQQPLPRKSRKSVRVSLALGRLLTTVENDATVDFAQKHYNPTLATEVVEEFPNVENRNAVRNSDLEKIEQETLKITGDTEGNNEICLDGTGDCVEVSIEKEDKEPCDCEQKSEHHEDKPRKCYVQSNDSVAVFTSDESDNDADHPVNVNDKKEAVPSTTQDVIAGSENKEENCKNSHSDVQCDSVVINSPVNNNNKNGVLQLTALKDANIVKGSSENEVIYDESSHQITQSRHQLRNDIDMLSTEVAKLKNILKTVDTSKLPDKGMKLQMKLEESIALLKRKERELKELPQAPTTSEEKANENIKPETTHRLPVGFGVKALQNQVKEKTLTDEALRNLHGSISSCPGENVLADDPLGLKSSVKLMPHQKHALAWLQWREGQKPPSGVLADDMGLGKTLTMISLVLKTKDDDDSNVENCEDEYEDYEVSGFPLGGTLVVCPASLLLQWEDEIKKHCKRGSMSVEIHHGSGREVNARNLSKKDIVITTYSIARTSSNVGSKDNTVKRTKRGVLHRIRWRRIILDEAHAVRNHKSQQSVAVCLLMGRKRWALTGTPIHNKEMDLYALLKFLRCSPFDDYNVWRRWVDNKNPAGIKRLNTVINAIMLRRTKIALQDKGELHGLPEKSMSEIQVHLDEKEYEVYTKVLWFSKSLFAQFLQQRAEKEKFSFPTPVYSKTAYSKNFNGNDNTFMNHPELAKMFSKMKDMHDVKTHEILVLLLRLRQICVHPGLIKAMLDQETKETAGFEDSNDMNGDVLSQFTKMSLEETAHADEREINVLQINNPVFDLTRVSSKMKAVFDVLEEKVICTSDKAIIVSQWTSVLNIMRQHMVDCGIKCGILSGDVPVKDRMDIVKNFNSTGGFQILLLSLTAGGVGLNLTGANYLFLIDLHWNPQLESQAFDRIYRVGQTKPVFIYKFICQETIEERIRNLQEKKLCLAEGVLSGSVQRNVSKLTLDDLKSLFSM